MKWVKDLALSLLSTGSVSGPGTCPTSKKKKKNQSLLFMHHWAVLSLPGILTHTHTHSHPHTHTHTRTHTLSHSYTHTLTLTFIHTHIHTLKHTLTRTNTHPPTLAHAHLYSHTFSLSHLGVCTVESLSPSHTLLSVAQSLHRSQHRPPTSKGNYD